MANVFTTDPYSLENVGFQQLMGSGGTQDMSQVMQALFGTLKTAGYEGFKDYNAEGGGWMGSNAFGGIGKEREFGHQDWMSYLDPESEGYGGFSESKAPMAEQLFDMLQSLDIPGLQKEYKQDIGDVKAEIGSQMQGLQKSQTIGEKTSRYSGIEAPRRNLGGGRQQYMSDYYGLQQKQFEMERDMQKSMEEDFYSQVGQYMQLNPAVAE